MKQRIREYEPFGKRRYVTRSYDGFTEFFLIKGFVAVFSFLFKFLLWYPIKYTIGLPFVIIGKIFGNK